VIRLQHIACLTLLLLVVEVEVTAEEAEALEGF
jgi:hypothetical protein